MTVELKKIFVVVFCLVFFGCEDKLEEGEIRIEAKVAADLNFCIGGILLEVESPASIGESGRFLVDDKGTYVSADNAINIPDFYRYLNASYAIEGLEKIGAMNPGVELVLICRKCTNADYEKLIAPLSNNCSPELEPVNVPSYRVTKVVKVKE